MTLERLAEIEARTAAATEGPWHSEHVDGHGCVHVGDYGWVTSGPHNPEYDVDSVQGRDDAEFIAHARTDVVELIAEIRRLLAENRRLRSIAFEQGQQLQALRRHRHITEGIPE
jgi:hypothetical protein